MGIWDKQQALHAILQCLSCPGAGGPRHGGSAARPALRAAPAACHGARPHGLPAPPRPPPRAPSYQQQGDRLQVENFKLSDELEASRLNLRDINEFLTNELKARTAANAALEERAAGLAAKLEEVKRSSEVRGSAG